MIVLKSSKRKTGKIQLEEHDHETGVFWRVTCERVDGGWSMPYSDKKEANAEFIRCSNFLV